MDVEEIALLCYLRRKNIQQKKKKEKIWVHPFITNRSKCGVFVKLYEDLLKYPEGGRAALTVQDKLAEYFVNHNPLLWQERNT